MAQQQVENDVVSVRLGEDVMNELSNRITIQEKKLAEHTKAKKSLLKQISKRYGKIEKRREQSNSGRRATVNLSGREQQDDIDMAAIKPMVEMHKDAEKGENDCMVEIARIHEFLELAGKLGL